MSSTMTRTQVSALKSLLNKEKDRPILGEAWIMERDGKKWLAFTDAYIAGFIAVNQTDITVGQKLTVPSLTEWLAENKKATSQLDPTELLSAATGDLLDIDSCIGESENTAHPKIGLDHKKLDHLGRILASSDQPALVLEFGESDRSPIKVSTNSGRNLNHGHIMPYRTN